MSVPEHNDNDSYEAYNAEIIKQEFLGKGKPVLLISHIDEDAKLLNAKTIYM